MSRLNLLIAPDFAPERFAGWHMLNTVLQRRTDLSIHLLTPASAAEQGELIARGDVDVVYANPFDAASMIRESGYEAIARPIGRSSEMVIAAAASSGNEHITDLKAGARIALTDNKDVRLIGLRLLEPADLTEADLRWELVESYQAAARMAIKGEVDACFMLAQAYHSLSGLTRAQLRPLIESKLTDITHVMLVHARRADDAARLQQALVGLAGTPDGQPVLEALGMDDGFAAMTAEDGEFMLDLMDTLLD